MTKRTATRSDVPALTAALYLRISLDRTGEGAGVERQEQECRALAARLGYEITNVFTDNSVSATRSKRRPAFDALVESRPAAVICWATDRLARRGRDLERIIDLDVPVLSVTAGPLDLATPGGRLNARLLCAVAQHETEQSSARRKAANRQRRANGRPCITVRPFGYKDRDLTSIDKREARYVVAAYASIINGESQSSIVAAWNARGITTTHGKPWRQSSLRQLLVAPRNAALLAHHGEIVGAGEWPAIIDENTWRAAQAHMTPTPDRKPGGARKFLLVGVAHCGTCGSRIGSVTTVRGQKQYVCRDKGCVGRDMADVDAYVEATILRRLEQPDLATEITDLSTRPDYATALVDADDARTRLADLGRLFGDGAIPLPVFEAGITQAQARLADAEQAMNAAALGTAAATLTLDPHAWATASIDARRRLIDAFVTVTIHPTIRGRRMFDPDAIHITWKA